MQDVTNEQFLQTRDNMNNRPLHNYFTLCPFSKCMEKEKNKPNQTNKTTACFRDECFQKIITETAYRLWSLGSNCYMIWNKIHKTKHKNNKQRKQNNLIVKINVWHFEGRDDSRWNSSTDVHRLKPHRQSVNQRFISSGEALTRKNCVFYTKKEQATQIWKCCAFTVRKNQWPHTSKCV